MHDSLEELLSKDRIVETITRYWKISAFRFDLKYLDGNPDLERS